MSWEVLAVALVALVALTWATMHGRQPPPRTCGVCGRDQDEPPESDPFVEVHHQGRPRRVTPEAIEVVCYDCWSWLETESYRARASAGAPTAHGS